MKKYIQTFKEHVEGALPDRVETRDNSEIIKKKMEEEKEQTDKEVENLQNLRETPKEEIYKKGIKL